MAAISIGFAAWVIYMGATQSVRPIWPAIVFPPALIINAILLLIGAGIKGGRLGRIIGLWLEVKEADLRKRLASIKTPSPHE